MSPFKIEVSNEYERILCDTGVLLKISVRFTCPDIQRIFNDIYEDGIIVSESNEGCEDFTVRTKNIIKTELHRIKRNEKINNILKNK